MIKEIKNCGIVCKVMGVVFIVFLIVLIAYYSAATSEKLKQANYIGKENNIITVIKTGTVYAIPDLAQVSISIRTEEKKVGDALKNNSEKSTAVIQFLKDQGISETDIKTRYFNVYPLYEWREPTSATIYSTGTRILVGYEAYQTIEVKIRDSEKISGIIEGAINAGANEVSNLNFIVENEEIFKTQARTKAIIDAKNEASKIAQTLGIKLGSIVSFTESSYTPFYDSMKAVSATGLGGESSVSIGENKIEVTVNIVFEIK